MKSVKEIEVIIKKLQIQVNELENQGSRFLDEAKIIGGSLTGSRFFEKTNDPNFEKWQELHKKADDSYIKAGELSKIITVWKYNLMHAKKAELIPIWAGIMREYEGRKIGAVREREITDKMHAVGVAGYFSKYEYSSPKIHLAFLDKNGFCCGSDYIELTGDYNISFYDEAGKFKMPDVSKFYFYGENIGYIENPKQYVKSLERLANKAKKAAAAYDAALHQYNAAAVPGFAQIDTYKTSPNSIAEYFRITK